MENSEPMMHIRLNGEEFTCTRDNSKLVRHLGSMSMYDHVNVLYQEQPPIEAKIFRYHEGYSIMEEHMLTNGYEVHVNKRVVDQRDFDSYERAVKKQVGDIDHLPEDWV